jgi:hypothetical protein
MKINLKILIPIIIPLILWLIHLFIIIPISYNYYGEGLMIFMFNFYFISGIIMMFLEIISVIYLLKKKNKILILAIILNLTWIYYLKVIMHGPTIGHF